MKAKMEKDLRIRKVFNLTELKTIALKSILNNQLVSLNLRQHLFLNKKKISAYKDRIHNRCILTGRSRSFIRFFKLSRIKFKELAKNGGLLGVKKSSW